MSSAAQNIFPRIGIFVVTFNASTTIGPLLARIPSRSWDKIAEVFIFDDNSQDNTVQVAADYKGSHHLDKVRVYSNQVNLGYGGNQKRGYLYAIKHNFDIVVLLHGDGQYAPEVMDDLLEPLVKREAEAVFGSRMMVHGDALKGGMPLYKYAGNKILTRFQNLLLGKQLSEYHSGYRAYSISALRSIPFLKNTNDFHFDTEIIIQLMEAGYRIKEVPIPTYYGGEISHVNGPRYAWDVVKTTTHYKLHKAALRYDARFDIKGGSRYLYKRNRFSSHSQILDLLDRAGSSHRQVLDVGCGSGVLASEVSKLGYQVIGVDAFDNAEARRSCAQFVVRNIEEGLGLTANQRFDFIIFADSLEHTRNPEFILRQARNHLKPDGRVIASTGNVANIYIRFMLLLGRFTYTERGILDRTHSRLFTPFNFRLLFKENSFRIRRQRSCPIPFEQIVSSYPRLAESLTNIYMLAVKVWPSLFAFQIVLEAEAVEDPIEQLRQSEIMNPDYRETFLAFL
jgi:2-polyprenyl-3-methyl-5-hydroxy-6-metoxy-1,4-benzoquinol methylase/GT2 family glycosyltransferase